MSTLTAILFGIVFVLFILYDINANRRSMSMGERLENDTAKWEKAKQVLGR